MVYIARERRWVCVTTSSPVCNRRLATGMNQPREALMDLAVASVLPPILPDSVRLFEDILRRDAPGSDVGLNTPRDSRGLHEAELQSDEQVEQPQYTGLRELEDDSEPGQSKAKKPKAKKPKAKKPKARSKDKQKEQETEDADEDAMLRVQHGMGTMRKLATGMHYIFQSKLIEDLSAVEVKGRFGGGDVCTVSRFRGLGTSMRNSAG